MKAQSIAKGQLLISRKPELLLKELWKTLKQRMTLKLGMLPVLSRINSSATKERKQVLGQQPDEPVMYEALGSILPYFEKAYELDQLPNEKGKIKPKFTKDIKGILGANHVYYINGGAYYFDQKDYNKAYDFFEQYLKYLICQCLKVRLSLKEIQTS